MAMQHSLMLGSLVLCESSGILKGYIGFRDLIRPQSISQSGCDPVQFHVCKKPLLLFMGFLKIIATLLPDVPGKLPLLLPKLERVLQAEDGIRVKLEIDLQDPVTACEGLFSA